MKVKIKEGQNDTCAIQLEIFNLIFDFFFIILAASEHIFMQTWTHFHTYTHIHTHRHTPTHKYTGKGPWPWLKAKSAMPVQCIADRPKKYVETVTIDV